MNDEPPKKSGLRPIAELVPQSLKRERDIRKRLLSDPFLVDPSTDGPILYQHSVLCQTCLPYRDPGDDMRTWERINGLVSLLVAAGQAFNPDTRKFVEVGTPVWPQTAAGSLPPQRRGPAHRVARHRARGQSHRVRETNPRARPQGTQYPHRQRPAHAAIGIRFSNWDCHGGGTRRDTAAHRTPPMPGR